MTAIMRLTGVGKFFGGGGFLPGRKRPLVRAVCDVDLAIPKGGTLGIVGESGCGKTTLARMLVGLERPSQGTVWYEDRDIAGLHGQSLRQFRKDVQFVFQDPLTSLNPRKKVRQILELPLKRLRGLRKRALGQRVSELADDVGLRREFLDRYPHELSGGQSQRVGIARALAAEPAVIVLDEPVSALDVSIQAQILTLLERLKTRHALTYVFISHDLTVVEKLADTVAVMYLGTLAEEGPVDALFSKPAHPYTQLLLASIPRLDAGNARYPVLEGEPPDPANRPPGCPFEPRCHRREGCCRLEVPEPRDTRGQTRAACFFADDPRPLPMRLQAKQSPSAEGFFQ